MTEQTPTAVEQVDRDAAADHLHGDRSAISTHDAGIIADVRRGTFDRHCLVQAFARHRLAATPTTPKADDIAEGLRAAAANWRGEHGEEGPAIFSGVNSIAFFDTIEDRDLVLAAVNALPQLLAGRATASGEGVDEAAVERGAKSMWVTDEHTGHDTWSGLPEYGRDLWRDRARACLSASLLASQPVADVGGNCLSSMPSAAVDRLATNHAAALAQVATLTARVGALEGALSPFAEADEQNPDDQDYQSVWPTLTVGDLRRARAALASDPAAKPSDGEVG